MVGVGSAYVVCAGSLSRVLRVCFSFPFVSWYQCPVRSAMVVMAVAVLFGRVVVFLNCKSIPLR